MQAGGPHLPLSILLSPLSPSLPSDGRKKITPYSEPAKFFLHGRTALDRQARGGAREGEGRRRFLPRRKCMHRVFVQRAPSFWLQVVFGIVCSRGFMHKLSGSILCRPTGHQGCRIPGVPNTRGTGYQGCQLPGVDIAFTQGVPDIVA